MKLEAEKHSGMRDNITVVGHSSFLDTLWLIRSCAHHKKCEIR